MEHSPFIHVIGLVGLKAAGKDVMAAKLLASNYVTYRISDAIRNEMALAGNTAPTVVEMQDFSNRRKKDSGDDGVWAGEVLKLAISRGHKLVVINGIRNPGEIMSLQNASGNCLNLVGIVAPTMLRYERLTKRQQSGDPSEFEKFLAMDDRDRGIGEPKNGQHVDRCLARVPHENVYNNVGTLEEYEAWVEATKNRMLAEICFGSD